MTLYYQCDLSQGTGRTRAYIEQRGAIVGKRVEIKDDGFTGLWNVDNVADKGVEISALREEQRKSRNAFASIVPMAGLK